MDQVELDDYLTRAHSQINDGKSQENLVLDSSLDVEPEPWVKELRDLVIQLAEAKQNHLIDISIQNAFQNQLYLELVKKGLVENTIKATEIARNRGYSRDPRLTDLG